MVYNIYNNEGFGGDFTELKIVKGIGTVREKQLLKMGIKNVEDLIEHLPRNYENRGDILPLAIASDGQKHSCVVRISSDSRAARIGGGRHLLKFKAYDNSADCEFSYFFRNPHSAPKFKVGEIYRMYGTYEIIRGKITCTNPIAERWSKEISLPSYVPIYRVTEGLSSKILSTAIDDALNLAHIENERSLFVEYLPKELMTKRNILPLYEMYRELHFPRSHDGITEARKSAVYREFFQFFALNISTKNKRIQIGRPPMNVETPAHFVRNLPYKLTDGQISALREIKADLNSGKVMHRIVVGDVGCGKTVVAEIAALMVANKGFLVAVMAPTEILAQQHFIEMSETFKKYGLHSELLLGSTPQSVRKRIIDGLRPSASEEEKLHLLVGTNALLNEKLDFTDLGLVIIDEQHRFGVAQRQRLIDKGSNVHSLSFSATPIPRSYAKMIYGDIDSSLITDLPPGRKTPYTQAGIPADMDKVTEFIQNRVLLGDQVYVVCPMIELPEDATQEERTIAANLSVEAEYERLHKRFPFYEIDILHGKMSAEDKKEAMRKFAAYETHVLVSTTVIEVGVNVPNATTMIIIGADRFGLAQLHQLRGRVSRGTKPSFCFLISSNSKPESLERLNILCEKSSGFDIAEADFKQRGPGDLLSMTKTGNIRQSGEFAFKYSDFFQDDSIMIMAHRDAEEFLSTKRGQYYVPLIRRLEHVSFRMLHE